MVDIVAVTPAYLGEAIIGNFRIGVYTSKWELALRSNFGYMVFTHRVAKYPTVNATTGITYPQFTVENITGILVERGGSLPSFAAGVMMKMDAIFFSLDPTASTNHMYNTVSFREYEVKEVERKDDPTNGGLAYYASHLNFLVLSNLGGL